PDARVTYMNKKEENVWFQIEGYKLLLSDYQIYAQSTADVKQTMEKLRELAIQNNTAGGTLYELAQMITASSPAEIIEKLKEAEDKRVQNEQAEQDQQSQLQKEQQDFLERQQEKQLSHDDYWEERRIQAQILEAEIQAVGRAKDNDIDSDLVPD